MIIEEMKKNSLIHLHVIPLWCIRWHGMQQNGHFFATILVLKTPWGCKSCTDVHRMAKN